MKNMISTIRAGFSEGNETVSITVEQFNQLQSEWILRTCDEETVRCERIKGIEMFIDSINKKGGLHDTLEITPDQAYDFCDEIYGGDSSQIITHFDKYGNKPVVLDLKEIYGKMVFGRYSTDSDCSGQHFREEHLLPSLTKSLSQVKVFLNVDGLSSGFLEESFGGLVRLHGFSLETLKKRLILTTTKREGIIDEIWQYAKDAENQSVNS